MVYDFSEPPNAYVVAPMCFMILCMFICAIDSYKVWCRSRSSIIEEFERKNPAKYSNLV